MTGLSLLDADGLADVLADTEIDHELEDKVDTSGFTVLKIRNVTEGTLKYIVGCNVSGRGVVIPAQL